DAVGDEHAPRGQQPRGYRRRAVQDVVEDDVVPLPVAGVVLRRVVDDAGRSDRADQFDVTGTAYPGDLGAHRRGDLDSHGPDAAGRAVDRDTAAIGYLSHSAHGDERGQAGQDGRGGVLAAPRGRVPRDMGTRGD